VLEKVNYTSPFFSSFKGYPKAKIEHNPKVIGLLFNVPILTTAKG
jgi:hypothetical protein